MIKSDGHAIIYVNVEASPTSATRQAIATTSSSPTTRLPMAVQHYVFDPLSRTSPLTFMNRVERYAGRDVPEGRRGGHRPCPALAATAHLNIKDLDRGRAVEIVAQAVRPCTAALGPALHEFLVKVKAARRCCAPTSPRLAAHLSQHQFLAVRADADAPPIRRPCAGAHRLRVRERPAPTAPWPLGDGLRRFSAQARPAACTGTTRVGRATRGRPCAARGRARDGGARARVGVGGEPAARRRGRRRELAASCPRSSFRAATPRAVRRPAASVAIESGSAHASSQEGPPKSSSKKTTEPPKRKAAAQQQQAPPRRPRTRS